MTDKVVYVGIVGDILHAGHINVLSKARELGRVVVGVLTDEAVADYKRVPFIEFADRVRVVENIAGIERVVPQRSLSYAENLRALKPCYVVHGDDWRYGDQALAARREVIETLAEWGGKLVEVPYTPGVSSTLINREREEQGVLARSRQARLRHLLDVKPFIRVIEAHSALAALIAYRARYESRTFDALWQSSLTDATLRGKPDLEIIDHSARLATINEIFDVTPLPLIYDGDTGGFPEKIYQVARTLDRAGVSALCLEDKSGSKRNSLFGMEVPQEQARSDVFCERIGAAKRAVTFSDMMFIARIESLIFGAGLQDALARAEAYVDAGADALLIHSIANGPEEVMEFAAAMRRNGSRVPIFVVPTTYGATHETVLADAGINGIIYANHLLRAAYPQMARVANHILQAGRSDDEEMRLWLTPIKDLLALIPSVK